LTGATGFVGQYLLRELPERGYRLRVLLRRPSTVPLTCASVLIGDIARPHNMAEALTGADAVIHSAGLAETMSGQPEDDYRVINTEATIGLARAASRARVKRFIFLSSIRAQSGRTASETLTEDAEPKPTDAYGRSKLAAEQGLAEANIDWVALRLALTYGPGVQGNMAKLIGLARSPYPLPFGMLKGRRSLLALDNLVNAIDTVLRAPKPLRRPLLVADPDPLTIGEMIVAMRQGLQRRPGIFPLPSPLLRAVSLAMGQRDAHRLLSGSLVADCTKLSRLGFVPSIDTKTALAAVARGDIS
jgi:UDP-glucose 4-epimerase